MKIWIQCFNYYPNELGGSERSARQLAKGFKSLGHDVRIIVSDGSKPYPEKCDDIPIEVLEGLKIGKSPLTKDRSFIQRATWNLRGEVDFSIYHRTTHLLRKYKPDIIFFNNPAGHGSMMMMAAQSFGVPYIPIIRDYGWFCTYGVMFKKNKICNGLCSDCKILFKLRRKVISKAHRIIAISDFTKKLTLDFVDYNPNKVTLIYNSVPDEFINLPRKPKLQNSSRIRFGYLGRLHPIKGINEILKGWELSHLYSKGHTLKLAGENQGISIDYFLKKDLNIEYLGHKKAIEFLDNIDVLLVTSTWAEPFGRSIIEAISRGTYVIGSSQGAMKELIKFPFGETLETITPKQIASTLENFSNNASKIVKNMSPQAIDNYMGNYSYENMMHKYNSVAEEEINGI